MKNILNNLPESKTRRNCLDSETSIAEAVRFMMATNKEAVVVTLNDRIIGTATEHDIIIKLIEINRRPENVTLRDVMDRNFMIFDSDLHADEVLNVMTSKGLRYAIIKNGETTTIIGADEFLRHKEKEARHENEHMKHYITGQYCIAS
jgi:predicted transcriptional regulator